MNEQPIRVLINEADPEAMLRLQQAAYQQPGVQAASVSSSLAGALQSLADAPVEVAILDGLAAGGDLAGFLSRLDQVPALVVVLLPPEQGDQYQALRRHPRVGDVLYKPVNPAAVIQRVAELGRQERERLYAADPARHREVVTGEPAAVAARDMHWQQVVSVLSFTGGSGKSTVAENLWYAANVHLSRPSLLVSLAVPDDHVIWMGQPPTPNMGTFVRRRDPVGLRESLQYHRVGPHQAPVMHAVATPGEQDKLTPAVYEQLVTLARKERYGAIVLDTPSTVSAETLAALSVADVALVVIKPNNADVQALAVGIQAFEDLARQQGLALVPRERYLYLINMHHDQANLDPRRFEAMLTAELGWAPPLVTLIPYEWRITQWQNEARNRVAYGQQQTPAVARAIDRVLEQLFPGVVGAATGQHRWLPRIRVR